MFTSMYMGNCLFSSEVEKEIETRINVIATTELVHQFKWHQMSWQLRRFQEIVMESNEKLTIQVLHIRLKIFKNIIIFIYSLLCLFFLYTFLDDFEIPICLN